MTGDQNHCLQLCNLWCEQRISEDQLTELQTLLRTDVELRCVFLDFMQLHGQLAWDAGVVAGSALLDSTHDDDDVVPEVMDHSIKNCRSNARQSVGIRRLATAAAMKFAALATAVLLIAGMFAWNWRQDQVAQVADIVAESDVRQLSADVSLTQGAAFTEEAIAEAGNSVESPGIVAADDASIIFEIDRLISKTWSEHDITPANSANDHEWVRRTYLTLTGRIPTVAEVSTFVISDSERRHSELIDSLLQDVRFGEHLSITWTNLLIGRSNARNVDQEALSRYLKGQFSNNRSWMDTIDDLIAAESRSDHNSATSLLMAHLNDQATAATAMTARLFFGQGSQRTELERLSAADRRYLVAQTMVNRTWSQIFGYGFTSPIDDLETHNPVSHPELLKFLSQAFVESGYDVQRLMRWLTLSQAFQVSGVQDETSYAVDNPQAGGIPLFSRTYPRPMLPEQVYDSIRIAVRSAADQPIDSSIGSVRRREWVEQFVQSYGTDENDEHLAFEGNIAQAMLMMNGEDLQAAIPRAANEITRSVKQGSEGIRFSLERIAMATLNRKPSDHEQEIFRNRLRSLNRTQAPDQAIRIATEDMLWAYLNSSEFTSVH